MHYFSREHRSAGGRSGGAFPRQIRSRHFLHLRWKCIYLQLTVMGGCHSADSLFMKMERIAMARAAPLSDLYLHQAHRKGQESDGWLFSGKKPRWSYVRRMYLMTVQYSVHHRYQHKLLQTVQALSGPVWNMKTGLAHESEKSDSL